MNPNLVELIKYTQDKYFENKIYELHDFESFLYDTINMHHVTIAIMYDHDNIYYKDENSDPIIDIDIFDDGYCDADDKFNIIVDARYNRYDTLKRINKKGTKEELKKEIDLIIGKLLLIKSV